MAYSSPSASGSLLGPTPTKPTISPSTSATNEAGKRRCCSRRCSVDGPVKVYVAAHDSTWTRAVESASSGVAERISMRPNLHLERETDRPSRRDGLDRAPGAG